MRIQHLFTGDDGQSHFGQVEIPEAHALQLPVTSTSLLEFPAGRWHDYVTTAATQLVVNLSGSAELEVGSGERWTIGPGDILLADDTWGQGHRSQTGVTPRRVLLLAIDPEFDMSHWPADRH